MSLADGRNIVLIVWTLMGILIVLGPGVGLFFAIKGLRILKRKIIPYSHQIRFYFQRVSRATHRASRTVAKPIIATTGATERAKFVMNRVISTLRSQED